MFKTLLFILCLSLALASHAEVLKLGRVVSDPAHDLDVLRDIGKYIVMELGGDTYDSYELVTETVTDKETFVKTANKQRIDISIDSSYAAAYYADSTNLEPALLVNRSNSVFLSSLFISRKDSNVDKLGDLAGKKLALSDNNSTPFYYLPIKAVKNAGLELKEMDVQSGNTGKEYVNYYYTNSKEDVIQSVYLKKADAGAVCSSYWNEDGKVPDFMKESLQVFYQSDSIPGAFLMIRSDMPEKIRNKIINILVNMNSNSLAKNNINDCEIDSFHQISFDWRALLQSIRKFQD